MNVQYINVRNVKRDTTHCSVCVEQPSSEVVLSRVLFTFVECNESREVFNSVVIECCVQSDKQGDRATISDRQHTIVCIIDPNSPYISAYDIHEWIYDQLQVQEHSLTMIQFDGTKRHMYLKFVDDKYIQDLLQSDDKQVEMQMVKSP